MDFKTYNKETYFVCASCDAINTQDIKCTYCQCAFLINFDSEISDESLVHDFDNLSINKSIEYGLFKCAACDYINNSNAPCEKCLCSILFEYKIPDTPTKYKCPACGVGIDIIAKNCRIFRCLELNDGEVNPHASEEEIKAYFAAGRVKGGCGKPLRWVDADDDFEVITGSNGELQYF
jgi:predicted metal-binding protein